MPGSNDSTNPFQQKFPLPIKISEPTDVLLSPIYMVLVALFIASCFKKLLIRSHYTYLMMIGIGIVIGVIFSWFPVDGTINALHIVPPLVSVVFWPSILLGKGITMNVHMLQKSWLQILLMTFVIYTLQVNVVGYFALKTESLYEHEYDDYTPIKWVCTIFLIASITSGVDAMLLTDIKKSLNSSKALISIMEGEAIATLIIAFLTYRVADQLFHMDSDDVLAYAILLNLLANICCGIFFGIACGIILTSSFRYLKFDQTSEVTMTLAMAHIMVILSISLPYGSSTLSVITYAFYMQTKLVFKDMTILALQWITHIFHSMLSLWVGIVLGHDYTIRMEHDGISSYWMPFSYYLFTYAVRLSMYLSLKPLLQLMGYGMTWQEVTIAIVCGIKELVFVLPLTFIITQTDFTSNLYSLNSRMFNNLVIICVLSYLINGLLFPYAMQVLGFSDVPLSRKINMYRAVQFVDTTKHRTMDHLKTELLTADADWNVVDTHTTVTNPFKNFQVDKSGTRDDFEPSEEYKASEIEFPSSDKSIFKIKQHDSPLRREILERILKISRVLCMRQYEQKLINHDIMRRVMNAIDQGIDDREKAFRVSFIRSSWVPHKFLMMLKKKTNLFLKPVAKTEYYKPQNKIRDKIYRLVQKPAIDFVLFIVLLIDVILSISKLTFQYSIYYNDVPWRYNVVDVACVAFYLLDIMLKITAFGGPTFFSSNAYKLDSLSTVISTVEAITPYNSVEHRTKKVILIISTISFLLTLFRCIIYGLDSIRQIAGTTITTIVENYVLRQQLYGYHVGRTYMSIIDEIQQRMLQIVDDDFYVNDINLMLENQRISLMEELGLLQMDYPVVAITAKTQLAMLTVIHEMKWTIENLADNGLIDKSEQQILMADLTKRKVECMKVGFITPRDPCSFIQDLNWLEGEEKMAEFLMGKTQILSFLTDEFLILRGEKPKGLYILVSGLVKTFYEPTIWTMDLSEKYGQLPNCDFLIHLNLSIKQDDLVVPGNVFGELGLLTGQPYDYSAMAYAGCQIYFIATEWVKKSVDLQSDTSSSLEFRIWKAIARHIALLITSQISVSGSAPGSEIRRNLRRGFVPNLQYIDSIPYTELIRDIYLIQGTAYDMKSGIKYVAPCYIPTSVKLIHVPELYEMEESKKMSKVSISSNFGKVRNILFIVPAEGVEEWEIINEILNNHEKPTILKAAKRSHVKLMEIGGMKGSPSVDRVPSLLDNKHLSVVSLGRHDVQSDMESTAERINTQTTPPIQIDDSTLIQRRRRSDIEEGDVSPVNSDDSLR